VSLLLRFVRGLLVCGGEDERQGLRGVGVVCADGDLCLVSTTRTRSFLLGRCVVSCVWRDDGATAARRRKCDVCCFVLNVVCIVSEARWDAETPVSAAAG